MDDARFGSAIRSVRIRRRWRQADLAVRSGVSQSTISRLERGHSGTLTLDTIRTVAAALDVRVDLTPRWRAGDLDRLLNARHSALHELVASWFAAELPAWVLAPEVSFSIRGERGVVDILAWHPGRRALLVIELKTEIADANELVGTFDRKRRLAAQIARERGWQPTSISAWVIVAASRTNRARIAAHRAMFRGAFPDDARALVRWLRDPVGNLAVLSSWPEGRGRAATSVRRVRRARVGERST